MFEANLIPMAEAADDLWKLSRELGTCLSETYGPRGFLQELSYMEQPLRRILKVQQGLDEKTAKALQMRIALENICQQYLNSERNIMDYCEEAAAVAKRREAAEFAKVGWISDRLTELIS